MARLAGMKQGGERRLPAPGRCVSQEAACVKCNFSNIILLRAHDAFGVQLWRGSGSMLYLANGIPEYWVLDAEARNLSRWRGAADPGEVLSARVEWQPAQTQAPFVVDLPRFFDEAIA